MVLRIIFAEVAGIAARVAESMLILFCSHVLPSQRQQLAVLSLQFKASSLNVCFLVCDLYTERLLVNSVWQLLALTNMHVPSRGIARLALPGELCYIQCKFFSLNFVKDSGAAKIG